MSAVRNFIITFLLSLMIFGLIAYGLVQFATTAFHLDGSDNVNGPSDTDGGETKDPDDTNVPIGDWVKGESFTALLVGTNFQPNVFDDYDVSEENETAPVFPLEPRDIDTETLLLVRINKETGECVFTAIPATTRITIQGQAARLQDLYAYEGIDQNGYSKQGITALCEKVTALTGIPVDYYAVIHPDNMIKLIDDLGGITYYVKTDMKFSNPAIGLTVNLRRGSQKLDGAKAMAMLRYPAYNDGDTSRRQCALDFMKELAKKILTETELANARNMYNKYLSYFDTNFTVEDLTDNVDLIFSFPKMSIKDFTYPGNTIGTGEDAYFNPNINKAIEFFTQYKYKG